MKNPRIKKAVLLGILGLALFSANPARSELNISLTFETAPTMLYLGEADVYVAVGTHYDLFFFDGIYFYFHDGYWYSAHGYNGPWNRAGVKGLPPGLRKNKLKTLQDFRDQEYKLYKAKGSAYRGETLKAVGGPGIKSKGSPKGPGKAPRQKGEKGKRK